MFQAKCFIIDKSVIIIAPDFLMVINVLIRQEHKTKIQLESYWNVITDTCNTTTVQLKKITYSAYEHTYVYTQICRVVHIVFPVYNHNE